MIYVIHLISLRPKCSMPDILRAVIVESDDTSFVKRHAADLLKSVKVPKKTLGVIVRGEDGAEIFRWTAQDGEYDVDA